MESKPEPQLIAFYLPQFHPIPENDSWWGPGFTEWTNVVRSKPLYPGHIQPRLPMDLGFYDLRLAEVREEQVKFARRAGVTAFCYYHYWFAGRRLLQRPLDEVLKTGQPDFPFCICWANENWTRRWDGLDSEILMAQRYEGVEPETFIKDLLPALRDPRYLRVNGKALLLVYRPELIPETERWAERWRRFAQDEGVRDLYLCCVHAFSQEDPATIGFDAAVEFPPLGGILERSLLAPRDTSALLESGSHFQGMIADYRRFSRLQAMTPSPPFRRFRCVMPSWDNSPRRGNKALIFSDANPVEYEEWLTAALQHTLNEQKGEERLVFLNAWNEWAEGCHLEPDDYWGDRYLVATRSALTSVRSLHVMAEKSSTGGEKKSVFDLLASREQTIRALSAELRTRDDTIRDLRRSLAAVELKSRSTEADLNRIIKRKKDLQGIDTLSSGSSRPKAIIFGAGRGGERAYQKLQRFWDIVAFVDNDINLHGERIFGITIHTPTEVQRQEDAIVFIASMYCDEIQEQLLTMGIRRQRIRHVNTRVLLGTLPTPKSSLDVIIFGTGCGGQRAYENLPAECRVIAFADNDPAKVGLEFCGYMIISPKEILSLTFDHVIVATSTYADDIISQLEGLGLPPQKIEVVHPDILIGNPSLVS